MAGVFLAPGPVAPPPGVNLDAIWPGVRAMTYQADGSDIVWDLLGDSGVVLMPAGVRGLTMPKVTRYTDSSPAVDGSRWRGYRTEEKDVFWPLFVYSDAGSQAWVEHDRQWWEGLEPDRLGTWTITHPDGTIRTLRVRFVDDSDHAWDHDPARFGWEVYGVHLVAEQPYWEGAPLAREWTATTSTDFFGGGDAPPFFISSGASLGTATMVNTGRLPAWPVWTVFGPSTSADLGLDGEVIEAHFAVASGKALVVDTDPTAQTAVLYSQSGGVIDTATAEDVTGDLGAANFRPIPPGNAVTLSLSMVGTGVVRAELQPRFWRAL